MKALCLLLGSALLLTGCTSVHSGVDAKSGPTWKVGETTAREIVAAWGNPDRITAGEWIWHETRTIGGKFKASYMMVGLTFSNTETATREYRCRFSEKGVLSKMDVVDSRPEGTTWSPIPF